MERYSGAEIESPLYGGGGFLAAVGSYVGKKHDIDENPDVFCKCFKSSFFLKSITTKKMEKYPHEKEEELIS